MKVVSMGEIEEMGVEKTKRENDLHVGQALHVYLVIKKSLRLHTAHRVGRTGDFLFFGGIRQTLLAAFLPKAILSENTTRL